MTLLQRLVDMPVGEIVLVDVRNGIYSITAEGASNTIWKCITHNYTLKKIGGDFRSWVIGYINIEIPLNIFFRKPSAQFIFCANIYGSLPALQNRDIMDLLTNVISLESKLEKCENTSSKHKS